MFTRRKEPGRDINKAGTRAVCGAAEHPPATSNTPPAASLPLQHLRPPPQPSIPAPSESGDQQRQPVRSDSQRCFVIPQANLVFKPENNCKQEIMKRGALPCAQRRCHSCGGSVHVRDIPEELVCDRKVTVGLVPAGVGAPQDRESGAVPSAVPPQRYGRHCGRAARQRQPLQRQLHLRDRDEVTRTHLCPERCN